MARYKLRRRTRYHNLKSYGFLPFEARELSKVRDTSAKYFRRMLLDRQEVIEGLKREAEYNRWSIKRTVSEIIGYIKYFYRENHWEFNYNGLWEMYRDYRDRALDMGEYYPKRRKKKRFGITGGRIDRGKLAEQKRRYKERLKKRGY